MKQGTVLLSLILLCSFLTPAFGQSLFFHGQASGWSLYADKTGAATFGARYIPELTGDKTFSTGLKMEANLTLNAYAFATLQKDQPSQTLTKLQTYRAWAGFTSDSLEARVGLQSISFGSATLFRPLMWFDRVDPRDPLRLTDGVYGLHLRYRLPRNTDVRLWGLVGNNDAKGWETAPSEKNSFEYGGRVQTMAGPGGMGFSYHHRTADTLAVFSPPLTSQRALIPENRFGVDGKWDFGARAWFEVTLNHGQAFLPDKMYQRQYVVGFDYTLTSSDNLNVLVEYFRSETAATAFGPSSAFHLGALSFLYPVSETDKVSGILYKDLTNKDLYSHLMWQSTLGKVIFVAIAFVNPEKIFLPGPQGLGASIPGSGGQIMLVFNH